jgi:hypothetical protein
MIVHHAGPGREYERGGAGAGSRSVTATAFRRLGAQSWEQRAEAELRACGVAITSAPGGRDA